MENPFFRNYYNATRPRFSSNPRFSSQSPRSIPVHQEEQQQRSKPSPAPKIVSIPVHFVGSEKTRSASAVKIQKVFRGFVVRKNVKKIVKIRSEACEIERRIADAKDLILSDAKERLRVNEMLMSLLLQLDSVRGVDSGVREFRKAVIRKVIVLQEAVDAIVALPDTEKKDQAVEMSDSADSLGNHETATNSIDQTLEMQNIAEVPDNFNSVAPVADDLTIEMQDFVGPSDNCDSVVEAVVDQTSEMKESVDSIDNCRSADQSREEQDPVESSENCGIPSESNSQIPQTQFLAEPTEDDGDLSIGSVSHLKEAHDLVESVQISGDRVQSFDNCKSVAEADKQCNEGEECSVDPTEETPVEANMKPCESKPEEEIPQVENPVESVENDPTREVHDAMEIQGSDVAHANQDGKSCDSSSGVMLSMMEKLMEENNKLKGLVTELCGRNAVQNRLMNSLSQRVEQLERVVARSERMRLKKKKRQAAAAVERSETAAETRKCGRSL
ncbi:BAG family molecular chaperone regulator 6-like [Magnolia sinica]|uniref:BAG family molecular chaperone regulator 6-like n=1 Tax=Magnolia sinica TaxID=86752 RepID=UPI00265B412C|nr:BAG family molecular chaperone regulator 6-like [Magnolia sinica]